MTSWKLNFWNFGICQDILEEQRPRGPLVKNKHFGATVSEILAQLCSDNSTWILLNLTWVELLSTLYRTALAPVQKPYNYRRFLQKREAALHRSWKWIMRTLTWKHKIWGGNWLYLRPYSKAFPIFNVLETCREYFLTIDLGIVEFIKKFIERFLEKCEIFRHGPNYVQKLYQKQLNAS